MRSERFHWRGRARAASSASPLRDLRKRLPLLVLCGSGPACRLDLPRTPELTRTRQPDRRACPKLGWALGLPSLRSLWTPPSGGPGGVEGGRNSGQDKANSPGSVAGAGITRRRFVQSGMGASAGLLLWRFADGRAVAQPIPIAASVLDPRSIPKYVTPLVIPPAMPRSQSLPGKPRAGIDYYEIAVREFSQHILPASMGLEPTTVWSYGSVRPPRRSTLGVHDRGRVGAAGARRVDQRPRKAERRIPTSPAAGRPDASLGEPRQAARRAATTAKRPSSSSTIVRACVGSCGGRRPDVHRHQRLPPARQRGD